MATYECNPERLTTGIHSKKMADGKYCFKFSPRGGGYFIGILANGINGEKNYDCLISVYEDKKLIDTFGDINYAQFISRLKFDLRDDVKNSCFIQKSDANEVVVVIEPDGNNVYTDVDFVFICENDLPELRTIKDAPLTHEEMDANISAIALREWLNRKKCVYEFTKNFVDKVYSYFSGDVLTTQAKDIAKSLYERSGAAFGIFYAKAGDVFKFYMYFYKEEYEDGLILEIPGAFVYGEQTFSQDTQNVK